MSFKEFIKILQDWMPPIHKEGHVFIAIFAIVSIFLLMINDELGYLGIIATIWCVAFFRDPERVTPVGDNFVTSPADGLITKIEKAKYPEELGLDPEEEVTRVTIFLNIFNVHVNRFPIDGEVTALNYNPGKFLSANLDKASTENERQSVVINTKNGNHTVVCVQIAGLIARRIVCYLNEKQEMQGGERYGLIKFGSRVDVYLPKGVNPKVIEGQKAIAGETVIADLKSKTEIRKGEVKK